MQYTKQALDFDCQLHILKERGLTVENIYKVDSGRFLDGDFTVKSISDDHIILHFYGHDAPTEIFDIDIYLNRVPTFLNQ